MIRLKVQLMYGFSLAERLIVPSFGHDILRLWVLSTNYIYGVAST